MFHHCNVFWKKHLIFSIWSVSVSDGRTLLLNVFKAFNLWWEKTKENRRTGFILKDKDNSRSGKHRDYFVHKWAGNWKLNYINLFKQFCHHNPKNTMHLMHDHGHRLAVLLSLGMVCLISSTACSGTFVSKCCLCEGLAYRDQTTATNQGC